MESRLATSLPRTPDTKTGKPKGALVDITSVRLLLERIGSLEKQTRPSLGEKSAMGKDLAAFEALSCALELVSHVAGWAIDHQCGLAKEGLEFLPLLDPEIHKLPEYSRRQQLVDTHELERIGALTKIEGSDNAQVGRKILRNILLADNTLMVDHKGVFPQWLNHSLRAALRALDFGEMSPLLEPIKVRKKRDLTQLHLQLTAVSMVAYRQGLGMTEEAAREYVARRMGQSEETLKSWKTRLRKDYGSSLSRANFRRRESAPIRSRFRWRTGTTASPPWILTKRTNMTTKPSSALLSTIRNPSEHNPWVHRVDLCAPLGTVHSGSMTAPLQRCEDAGYMHGATLEFNK